MTEPRTPTDVLSNACIAEAADRIEELARLLRRCAVYVQSFDGGQGDAESCSAAIETPLEEIPELVNSRVAEMETRMAKLRSENARLRASVGHLQQELAMARRRGE